MMGLVMYYSPSNVVVESVNGERDVAIGEAKDVVCALGGLVSRSYRLRTAADPGRRVSPLSCHAQTRYVTT
jgi:hypothetical protein